MRATGPAASVRAALRQALAGDLVLFTSPAAVRFAADLASLHGHARSGAVGRATARALARHGIDEVLVPTTTQDSEGVLAHPALASVRGWRIAVVGAPGGRGVLQQGLRERGAAVADVAVYQRMPARLDARHGRSLQALRRHVVMLSSVETLGHLQAALTDVQWQHLVTGAAVVSSARVGAAARAAGFARVVQADSALDAAMLARAVAVQADT